MKKPNYFLVPYAGESMEVRRKTSGLFIGSIILGLLALSSIGPLFLLEVTAGTVLTIVILILAAGLIALALAFLRMKRPNTSVYILAGAGPVAIYFIYWASTQYSLELGRLSLCYAVVMALISLVAFKRGQLILYSAESLSGILAFALIKLGTGEWKPDSIFIKEIVYDVLLFGVDFGFTIVSFSIIEDRMRMSELEVQRERERLAGMDAIFSSARDGIGIGGALIGKAQDAKSKVEEINRRVAGVFGRVEGLSGRIEEFSRTIADIVRTMEAIGSMNEDYSSVVVQTSGAVEEITASINSISSVSQSKREAVSGLAKSSAAVQQEMESALKAIQAIAAHSDSLLEIVDVINGVASRTNLLAMNAAIEAAHAGDSGRGFAVVADEIRRLSEETNENIKIIANTLKGSVADAAEAIGITERAGRYFSATREEIVGVEKAIGEIIGGMAELSAGTGEIMQGTSTVNELSGKVTERIREGVRQVRACGEAVAGIKDAADAISSMMRDIRDAAGKIEAEVAEITAMGATNKAKIEEFGEAVKSLREEEA
jgi:methyl-accepting chemotaxis protein